MSFLARVRDLCQGFLVLDTLVALEDGPQTIDDWEPDLSDVRDFSYANKNYRGRLYREYPDGARAEERALSTTASHANVMSVWLTEDALVSVLSDVGFEHVEKVVFPRHAENWWSDPNEGRVLYVAWGRSRFSSAIFDPADQ